MIDQDDSSGGARPASPGPGAPPGPQAAGEAAFKIVRSFARGNGISTEAGAELHAQVAKLLADGTGEDRARAVLAAWHGSGKPPGALPEFVELPP